VRAFWCERYDANGTAIRTGPYWEMYSNGRTRTEAHYLDSQLTGPVSIRNEDGSLFLRGFLDAGEWSGPLEMFHQNGAVWFDAHFTAGSLDGDVRTRFSDGALESETRFQAGREDGLARSFYPTTAGGRLKSEAQVEADQLVGPHRVMDRRGKLVLRIDWDSGPLSWRNITAQPAAPDFGRRDPSDATRERDLRD
jgi:antitoxin component YwqK of YwqJK toxin-antitoxin module